MSNKMELLSALSKPNSIISKRNHKLEMDLIKEVSQAEKGGKEIPFFAFVNGKYHKGVFSSRKECLDFLKEGNCVEAFIDLNGTYCTSNLRIYK